MESFGLGDLFKYYEKYFGERVTKGLLALGALAFVAVCVALVTTWLIMPVLDFLQTTQWQGTIITAVLAALGIGSGVALGLWLTAALSAWRKVKQMQAAVERSQIAASRSQSLLAATVVTTRETVRLSAMSETEKAKWDEELAEAESLIARAGNKLEDIDEKVARTLRHPPEGDGSGEAPSGRKKAADDQASDG